MADRDTDPRVESTPVDSDAVGELPSLNVAGDAGELPEPITPSGPVLEDTTGQMLMYEGYPEEVESALVRTERFVRDQFGDEVAKAVTRPNPSLDELPDGVTMEEVWAAVEPVMAEELPTWRAADEFRRNFAEQGGNPAALDWSYLRAMAAYMGDMAQDGTSGVANGLAESRSWWSSVKKGFANTAARVITHPDFQVGLQTLDFFTWANKKTKLAFVPREERAEIEQRVLPKITLDDGSTYQVATGQAISNLWDRAWGANTQLNGWAIENLGKLVGSQTLQDVGQRSRKRGAEMRTEAAENISEAASLMGEHLSWTEVIERNDPGIFVSAAQAQLAMGGTSPEEWDKLRAEVRQADSIDPLLAFLKGTPGGDSVLASWAITDGVAELALDPTVIAGEAVAKAPVAVQAATKALAPAKHAQVTSKVARTTRRFEDAIDAVDAARAHVARVEEATIGQARRTGGQISREQAIRLSNARRQLANEEAWMGRFADPGPNDVIIPRSRRTHPEHPSVDMKTTEKYVENYPYIDRETGQFSLVEVEGEFTRQKTTTELAQELHELRVKELGRDADSILPRTDQTEGLPLFGVDDAEQAGDALNHVVRTGGVGMDDVWLHQPNPLHETLPPGFGGPETEFGLIDWRALDTANDVTKAERQFLSSSGARQFELGYSTRRGLHRQMDIVRQNLGAARAAKNKPAIKTYEKELRQVKEAIRAAKDDEVLIAADKAFDKRAWLPRAQKSVQEDPGRFSQMLESFSDVMLETAYPGGFGVRRLQQTKFGQLFIPFREPQRFYETFAPDMWDRVSGGFQRYHSQNRAWNEALVRNGEKAGLLKKRSNWDPRKAFKPYEVDEAKNEQLFDLLNTRVDSDEFAELAANADDALMALHDDIRKQMDHWADVQGIGKGPDSPRYLGGYMRHAVTADQFAGGARPIEYIGVPRNADVFVSHLLPRTGDAKNIRKDALAVLDLYGRAANRKLHVEPLFDDIMATGSELAAKHKNPIMQQYANDLVAELSGKPTPWMARVDQFMGWGVENFVPRITREGGKLPKARLDRKWEPGTLDRTLTGLSGLLWAGTLPGNPRYGLMQIATGVATTGSRYGLYRTTRGLFQQATREGQAVSRAAGTYDEFLNIFESDKMRAFSKLMAEKGYSFSPMGVMSTGMAEEFIRGMTFHAAVDMHMTKLGISTWAEAAELGFAQRIAMEAVRSSQEVNHMFGALGRSPMMTRGLFQSKGLATSTTQFLSFMPKQTEELLSQFNRNPGYIVEYMALSGAMSRIAAETGGIDITNYVGLGYLPTDPVDDFQSPLMGALQSLIGFAAASSQHDRQEMALKGREFLDTIDNLMPMMVAWEAASRGAERLTTGEHISSTGKLNRSLEMGEFSVEDVTAEGLGSALGPVGLQDQDAPFPTVGGDVLPALFGQQAIRDRLQRRGIEAMNDTIDRYLFEAQVRVGELQDALQEDDVAAAREVIDILRTDFNIYIDPKRALENRIYSQELGAVFRTLNDRAPKQVKKQIYDQIQNFGLRIE